MKFESYTIAPAGRNKYGTYVSSGNVTRMVTTTTYGGNGSTEDIGGGSNGGSNSGSEENLDNWLLFLSKTNGSFIGEEIALEDKVEYIDLIGYRGTSRTQTFVGTINTIEVPDSTTDTGTRKEYQYLQNIAGIPSGMTVEIVDNFTDHVQIKITLTKDMEETSGVLSIPCNIHYKTGTLNSLEDWGDNIDSVLAMDLEYTWDITHNVTSAYVLDLDNESAGINCDKDGNILSGAQRPTCTATLYYGKDKAEGVKYNITYNASQSVVGVTINTDTGVLTFGSNFSFTGNGLEISVTASMGGVMVGKKIMTITKMFPGTDGKAITRWIVTNADQIKYDPNTVTVSPATITAKVMKQENENAPVEDTSTTIFYGYDTNTPSSVYSGAITPDVTKEYLAFGLKTASNVFYEIETVPIISDGKNGASVYRLDLTNENAGINCDKDGNILSGAQKPTCTATLYYGSSTVSGVAYSISTTATGVSINSSTGVLTFASNFTFSGTSVEITVSGKKNNVLLGTAIMTVSKNYAGQNGTDATTYWLNLSANEVKVDVNNSNACSPASITATAYKQVGENTPVVATDVTIKFGADTPTPSGNYTSAITTSNYVNNNYLTFRLMKGTVQVDIETVPILREGKNGSAGGQGRQGAAVRGPVNWYDQNTSRRFCNGTYNSSYPEDGKWIDIISKDGVLYYCNTSYTGSARDSWSSVSSKWTQATEQFDFIATKLLLANNASIDFLTGNEIYLRDNNGNITAGAAGGNGVSFWAGGDSPSDSNFQVDYQGNITAKSGTFSGYVQMPYTYINELNENVEFYNASIGTKHLIDYDYKGRFASAPSSPVNGWCYYNTNSSRFFIYRNSWYQMNPTGTYGYTSDGYIADKRCNIIVDGSAAAYGMFDGADLILPEPSAAYDGLTYRLVMEPNIATKTVGLNSSLTIRTNSTSNKFKMYFHGYTLYYDQPYAVKVYGGYMTVTCIPTGASRTSYQWAITECTGGGDCFDKNQNNIWGFGSVFSYNDDGNSTAAKSDLCINRIVAKTTFSSDDNKTDTLRIQR